MRTAATLAAILLVSTLVAAGERVQTRDYLGPQDWVRPVEACALPRDAPAAGSLTCFDIAPGDTRARILAVPSVGPRPGLGYGFCNPAGPLDEGPCRAIGGVPPSGEVAILPGYAFLVVRIGSPGCVVPGSTTQCVPVAGVVEVAFR